MRMMVVKETKRSKQDQEDGNRHTKKHHGRLDSFVCRDQSAGVVQVERVDSKTTGSETASRSQHRVAKARPCS
eukprot:1020884-Rhodomonas_salina.6